MIVCVPAILTLSSWFLSDCKEYLLM